MRRLLFGYGGKPATVKEEHRMCPICVVQEGKEVEIVRLLGGRGFVIQLQERGIYPGSSVGIVRNGGGAMLLSVGTARFAIGRGMAERILVKERNE